MTTSSEPSSETTLRKEWLLFREIFDHLLDILLNAIFNLHPEKARRRMRILKILIVVSGLLITLHHYPLILWKQHIQEIFLYLLNPASVVSHVNGNPFSKFFALSYQVVTDARLIQYLPLLLGSFFIALQLSAIYIADIFELPDVSTAQRFVLDVSFLGSNETIYVIQGDIAEQHRESLNYLIGGPCKVFVDVNSVALFERADGTPHVIGPTGKEPDGKATIEGFERLRYAIYIRDNYIEFNDEDYASLRVMARSRDGIPFIGTDARFVYSIYRGENAKPSLEVPFPFSKEAVENIAYKSRSRVTPELPNPSTDEFAWGNRLHSLLRRNLISFMSERNLAEFLAHTTAPSRAPISHPELRPFNRVTNLFSKFVEESNKQFRDYSFELHWIGSGIWKIPYVMSEKQLETWILSQKNLRDANDDVMKNVESEAFLQKMETMIKKVPIEAYYDVLGIKSRRSIETLDGEQETQFKHHENNHHLFFDEEEFLEPFGDKELTIDDLEKPLNEKTDASAAQQMRSLVGEPNQHDKVNKLLLEYSKQLQESYQFMKTKNKPLNSIVEEAIDYIDRQIYPDNELK